MTLFFVGVATWVVLARRQGDPAWMLPGFLIMLTAILWIRVRVSTPGALHLRSPGYLDTMAGLLLACILLAILIPFLP